MTFPFLIEPGCWLPREDCHPDGSPPPPPPSASWSLVFLQIPTRKAERLRMDCLSW